MRVLITGACGVTSRAVARSLRLSRKFSDLYLLGIDICENPYGVYEGLLDKIYRAPRVTAPGYRGWVEELLRAERLDAAIVIPELEVVYWSAARFPVAAVLPPPKFCHVAVSKRRLYEVLAGTGLIPSSRIVSREQIMDGAPASSPDEPCWMRDFSEGSSSGRGSLLVHGREETRAWAVLNAGIREFLLSEYLPGRNFACHLLYDRGHLVKTASYERLEYFMARTAISGVTGNISRGRLVNDGRLAEVGEAAVARILHETREEMHGLVTVDLREDRSAIPKVTEVNLRHTAATYSFAAAGFNISEAQLLLALGRVEELGPKVAIFPEHNILFRDIDGAPVWIRDYRELSEGESVTGSEARRHVDQASWLAE